MGVEGVNNSWAKGSQYFAKNLPIQKPELGIIVDMIGDSNLEIQIERNSYRVAPDLITELWDLAKDLQLPAFQNRLGYDVYDDHIPLWETAGIPTIDLIDFNYPNKRINYWHTLNDIPQNCSSESLGQVVAFQARVIRPEFAVQSIPRITHVPVQAIELRESSGGLLGSLLFQCAST